MSTNYLLNYEYRIVGINTNLTYEPSKWLIVARDIDVPDDKKHHIVRGYNVQLNNAVIPNSPTFNHNVFKLSLILCKKKSQYPLTVGDSIFKTFEKVHTFNELSQKGQYDFNANFNHSTFVPSAYILYDGFDYESNVPYKLSNFSINHIFGAKAGHVSYPIGGYVNPIKDNHIKVNVITYDVTKIKEPYTLKNGNYYYREKGQSNFTSIPFTGNKVNVPANTFQTGKTYETKVVAILDDNQSSTLQSLVEITTVDAKPTCTLTAPINEITYGEINFQWQHEVSTGTEQTAFDLQISKDKLVWEDVANHVLSNQKSLAYNYNVSGTIYWKARTYNQNDVASEWSDVAMFVNNVPPQSPTISEIISGGRPIIKWSAEDQIAFAIELDNVALGVFYSTDKTYRFSYIENGFHEIKIRVINGFGKSSAWQTITYTQSMPENLPIIKCTQVENALSFNIQNFDIFSKVYVIKDNVLIQKITTAEFMDYFVNGEHDYIFRGVMSDDTFTDLNLKANYRCVNSVLISLNKKIIPIHERLDNRPQINYGQTQNIIRNIYSSRVKTEHIFTTDILQSWNIVCSNDDIKKHLKEVLFYRNYNGDVAFVVITNISSSIIYYGNEVNVTLEETDFSEVIEYDL